MTNTYVWVDAEGSGLTRTDENGNEAFVPADLANRDYAQFLASGATAADYVAPPEPEPESTEQKVNRLLSDYGLTREEMQAALAVE